jgi:hypothetical protein
MSTQEKIQQLALAALRSAPPSGVPKPATFMAPFEKPKTMAIAEKAAEAVAPAPVETVEAPAFQEAAPLPFKDEADPELRAMIETRDVRIDKQLARQSLLVTVAALAVLAAFGTWFATSPKAQAQAKALVPALKQTVADAKMIGSITSQYDESLKEIGGRGTEIDKATRALGADPTKLGPNEDPNMEAEMKGMMGEDGGPTTAERDRALNETFGVVGKLVGKQASSPAQPTAPQS